MKMGNASSADSLTIEASHATGHGDHRLDRLIDRLPDRLRTTVRWLWRPGARRRIRLFTGARLLDVSARAGLACRRRAAADWVRSRVLDWIERCHPEWLTPNC